jgi:hypothetical protein
MHNLCTTLSTEGLKIGQVQEASPRSSVDLFHQALDIYQYLSQSLKIFENLSRSSVAIAL